jgi:hypothetical protein
MAVHGIVDDVDNGSGRHCEEVDWVLVIRVHLEGYFIVLNWIGLRNLSYGSICQAARCLLLHFEVSCDEAFILFQAPASSDVNIVRAEWLHRLGALRLHPTSIKIYNCLIYRDNNLLQNPRTFHGKSTICRRSKYFIQYLMVLIYHVSFIIQADQAMV